QAPARPVPALLRDRNPRARRSGRPRHARPMGIRTMRSMLFFLFAIFSTISYSQGQIRIVVPFTPGGGTDVITRIVAQHLTEAWSQPVIVDNRVGAGGVVGSKWVAEQAPDGRTFLAVASAFGVRAAIDRSVPYDVNRDFTGVAQM